ncbi:MAG: hypothetical protein JWR26_1816 [Pedosphaera sp.]|nr:hypothetical protein [Pedosphaera sp.]
MELLVVVAIIGILAAMLLPALQRSKSRALAIMCMNNSKHLTLAWTMYSSDNENHLAYNLGGDALRRTFAPTTSPNWVNNIIDWELSPDNTNTEFVTRSVIAPYAGWSVNAFHCPADHSLSAVQKSAGWNGRVRSVSMNAMVGDPGPLLKWGANTNNPHYQQFLKDSDIIDPSSIFVFLDEHPDSINDGYFLNTPDTPYDVEWIDLPASYHNGGGSFSFADGHTEIHRWRNPETIRPTQPDAAGLPISLRLGQRDDFNWVIQHTSVERN